MKLVIVESPTKAKTIGRFLGPDYNIRASMGHVMDLPKSKLGIAIDKDFAPQYEIVNDRKQILTELKKLAKDATHIILATDPDREGEAIAAHIKEALTQTGKKKDDRFSRISFHEITQSAIEDAIKNPKTIDEDLVNAQTARRVLDRLVGYKLSPILWQKIRRGLSAGRVQSVALRLIVEREREIQKFSKELYWTVAVFLKKQDAKGKGQDSEFELVEINGKKIESMETHKLYNGEYKVTKTSITSADSSEAIANDLKTKIFTVSEVNKKQSKRSPQPPYTTSTLQQDAARRCGFSGKRTMSLAQKLYEEGFITYHRTDSVNLAVSAVEKIKAYVIKEFGNEYVPAEGRQYHAKQKNAQEAHEAIRPTDVYRDVSVINERLGIPYGRLYELIWRRAIASQMSDAQIGSTTVFVLATEGEKKDTMYRLKTTGSILMFEGFLKVNPFGLQDRKIPDFIANEVLNLHDVESVNHETPPPPRYNDASIISSLEEEGIGRPSTYAAIISTIEARQYIERQQGRFVPTAVGMAVNDFLVEHFSNIDDIPFTAHIEDELDQVAKGDKNWVTIMKEFYGPFEERLKVVGAAGRVKIEAEEVEEKCPKDDAPLVIRVGKFGKFLSCKNFPTCDFKKPYVQDINVACPKDGTNAEKPGRIVVKKTRKGRSFYGCTNYPTCEFAVWKLQDIPKAVPETQPEVPAN